MSRNIQYVYLDTSIIAGSILKNDLEDKEAFKLISKIKRNKYPNFEFITSSFTLIEVAEVISRKKDKSRAKVLLWDIVNNPSVPILPVHPEPVHKKSGSKEYHELDELVAGIINTALEYKIPGYDTIHAHTVKNIKDKVIAVSKDKHFKYFQKLSNVSKVMKASEFIEEYK